MWTRLWLNLAVPMKQNKFANPILLTCQRQDLNIISHTIDNEAHDIGVMALMYTTLND
jgi:hypothetical protein